MSRGRVAGLIATASIAAAAALAPAASAAELQGDYQFQGTRASSSGPGPALVEVGPGNSFQTENVMGETRQVLRFVPGGALRLDPFPIPNSVADYSIVMTLRLDDAGPVTDLMDPTDGAFTRRLQVTGGHLNIYNGSSNLSADTPIAGNTYATVAFTVDGIPFGARGYVNGNYVAGGPSVVLDVADKKLRFFGSGPGASAGAVSCIRTFLGALTQEEVTALGANPRCGAPGPPAVPAEQKKCKKKKKGKKRASFAKKKKKKCKKKGKKR